MKTNKEEFEDQLGYCFAELKLASKEPYDAEKAVRTAAAFLDVQIRLAYFMADIEVAAKTSKSEIARVEAVRYSELKEDCSGKKTEVALAHALAKSPEVLEIKKINTSAEADLKKYQYLMASLKDGHLLFRGLSKKAWNE